MKKSLLLCCILGALALFQGTSCRKDNNIPIADLPAGIKTYVDANFSGYTLDEAETDTDCSGATVYDVEIEQGEENEQELTFDAAGNFLYSETEISLSDLPAAVTNSLADHYAGFTAEEPNKLSLADGSIQYEVDVEKGNTEKEVRLDMEGIVLCERDEE